MMQAAIIIIIRIIKLYDLQEAFIHHARPPRPSFQKGQCRCFMTGGVLWYKRERERERKM